MTAINVSKERDAFAYDVAIIASFSSEELAKSLGYKKENEFFLRVKPNPVWNNLSNDHDLLNVTCEVGRPVSVRYFLSDYSEYTQVEFVVVEPKLKIYQDLTAEFIDEQTLFRERMRVKVLETSYEAAETTQIVHEFAAEVALSIADKICGR